jgi:hypothetical protein
MAACHFLKQTVEGSPFKGTSVVVDVFLTGLL